MAEASLRSYSAGSYKSIFTVVVVLETTRPLDIPTYVVDSRWVVCVLRAPLPLGGGAYIYLPIPKPVS